MLNLPLELLHLIFDELEYQRDFQALFACALTTKLLVRVALQRLYRIYPHSNILSIDDDFFPTFDNAIHHSEPIIGRNLGDKKTRRRKILWRSIILSSIDKTAYPYCLFLRSLHLNDMTNLFQNNFKYNQDKVTDPFFMGDMAQFFPYLIGELGLYNPVDSTPYYSYDCAVRRIVYSILSYIEDSSKQPGATAKIEHLFVGNRNAEVKIWVNRLPKLKTLQMENAAALDLNLAKVIVENCPDFCNLNLTSFGAKGQDAKLGLFLKGLKQNTLQRLIIESNFAAAGTFLSLHHHAESLTSIHISGVESFAARKLGLLKACKALTSIQLSFNVPISLMPFRQTGLVRILNEQHKAIIDWLCGCRSLRELGIENLSKGATILAQVCGKNWIRLQKLKLVGFKFDRSLDLFMALSCQTALEYLYLGGDVDSRRTSHINVMMRSIAFLKDLKYLRLTADYGMGHCSVHKIIDLIPHIPRIEELIFTSFFLNESIWPALFSLHHLRVLSICCNSGLTVDGVLKYVNSLKETNKGLKLSIKIHGDYKLLDSEQESLIQRALGARVGGKLTVTHEKDSREESSIIWY